LNLPSGWIDFWAAFGLSEGTLSLPCCCERQAGQVDVLPLLPSNFLLLPFSAAPGPSHPGRETENSIPFKKLLVFFNLLMEFAPSLRNNGKNI
jgi:hypothetical protein